MAFQKIIGGITFEIEPIAPFTENDVIMLIDDDETVNEHHPLSVIKKKKSGEPIAEFKLLD